MRAFKAGEATLRDAVIYGVGAERISARNLTATEVDARIKAARLPSVFTAIDFAEVEKRVMDTFRIPDALLKPKEAPLTDTTKKTEPLSIQLLRERLSRVDSGLKEYQGYTDESKRQLDRHTESRDQYAAQKKDLEAAIKKLGGKITVTKTVTVEA